MLEECRIGYISGASDVLPTPHQITLPLLKTLILAQVPGQEELLSLLVSPSLETLSSRASLCILSSFITRSKCELHHLDVDALDGTPEEFIGLLEKTPYLIKLEASDCDIQEAFFERLAVMSLMKDGATVSEAFLPLLCMLCLTGSPYFKWSSIPSIFLLKHEGNDFITCPLYFLELTLFFYPEGSEEFVGQTPDVIDADVKERLLVLQADGKEIHIISGMDNSSLL
ncbi:unnamed protein product [Cyclocybe aegerita]|uniref:Uncharacterized protein n=1 Tax=Cyclocybe aegerita TaxID=1973307 RepID=A0A8S0VXT5_CYCAE|nr:unnamed protein product [Cyclocybe aegerita]